MLWLYLALLSALLWSCCNHLDKYLLEAYYQDSKAGALMFLTSAMSLMFSLTLIIIRPDFLSIHLTSALVVIGAGMIYFLAIFPYLYALMGDEASRVVPLFQVQPVFSYLLAYLFLHEQLSLHQLLAGFLIILGAVLISIDRDSQKSRLKKTKILLMLTSALLFASEGFLFKFIGRDVGFWSATIYQDIGCALAGLVTFWLMPGLRNDFLRVIRRNGRAVLGISLMNESFNLVARAIFNYATLLAPLALVTLASSTQPIFVLVIGVVLTLFLPKFSQESLLRRHMFEKISAIVIISIGTALLFR